MALEPLVRRARSVSWGSTYPEDRKVRIADRWLSWTAVGASYAGVVAASRAAEAEASPGQRDAHYRPKWAGSAYGGGGGGGGGDAGGDGGGGGGDGG